MSPEAVLHERRLDIEPIVRRSTTGAALAGAVVTIAAMVFLGSVGVALRVTALDVAEPSLRNLVIAASVWTVVAGLVALLAGGYAAGRLCALRRRWDGLFHGLVVWALVVVAGEIVTRPDATPAVITIDAWWTVAYLWFGAVAGSLGGWLGVRTRRSPRP